MDLLLGLEQCQRVSHLCHVVVFCIYVDAFVHIFDAQDAFVCSDAITGHQACIPLLCVCSQVCFRSCIKRLELPQSVYDLLVYIIFDRL